jgi:hypothetical protein
MNNSQYKKFIKEQNQIKQDHRRKLEYDSQQNVRNLVENPNPLSGYSIEHTIGKGYVEIIERQTDNIYVNIQFSHDPPANYINTPIGAPTNEAATNANYSVTRTNPILDKCSDYYCSVVRFTIPLNNVPLMICPIIPNTNLLALANKTPMVVNIHFGGIFYSANLQFLPEESGFPVPLQDQQDQVVTQYHYIFAYQTIINMFNQAFNVVWVISGLQGIFPTIRAPYVILDPATGLLSIIVPKCFVTITAPLVEIPTLGQNIASTNYLGNFLFTINIPGQMNGNDQVYKFQEFGTFYPPDAFTYPIPFTPATTDYYKFTQEYSSLLYWSSIRRIIFTTAGIPTEPETIPSINNNASQNILTDFIVDTTLVGDGRSIAYYIPSGQYRLIDLNSDTPLQKLDVRIFWEDLNNNIYPLGITVFQQASIKLLFTRKSLYKNY